MKRGVKTRLLRKVLAVAASGFIVIPLFLASTGAVFAQTKDIDTKNFKFNPGIPIPTVRFSDITVKTVGKLDAEGKQINVKVLDIPWLGNYIGGVYEYAIGIAIIIAAVMAVIGGFQYTTAGGDAGKVSAARDRIMDALVGSFLVLGAYVMLNTVSTQFTELGSIQVQYVEGQEFTPFLGVRPGVEERGGVEADRKPDAGKGTPIKGAEMPVVEGIKKAAAELGVDACAYLGISEHESGLRLYIWNGSPGGNPKEKGACFGPGAIDFENFVQRDPKKPKPLSIALKKRFGDAWPSDDLPFEEQKKQKIEAILTNAELSTWAGVWTFKNMGGRPGNEASAIASYAAGPGSMGLWRSTNGCKSQSVPLSEFAEDLDAALKKACLPQTAKGGGGAVEVPRFSGGKLAYKCGPEDKGYCPNAKIDASATFNGVCSNGTKCLAMDTNDITRYVANAYKRMQATYNCQ